MPFQFTCRQCGAAFTRNRRSSSDKNNAPYRYCSRLCANRATAYYRCIGHPKHGLAHIPEYKIWNSMKHRCADIDNRDYPLYGGRGITVCDRWLDDFLNFYADMGPRPSDAHSIDRRENNGNYEPGNCRWATASEQAQNRRPSRRKGP